VLTNFKGGVDGKGKDLKKRLRNMKLRWNRREEKMMHPTWPDSKKPINNTQMFSFKKKHIGDRGLKCIG
jgi:hypothetical protein